MYFAFRALCSIYACCAQHKSTSNVVSCLSNSFQWFAGSEREQDIGRMAAPEAVCRGQPGVSWSPFVLAFGQDDGGEVYLLGTSIPSYAPGVPATGVIYQVTDPARYCKPCIPTHN